MGIVNNNQSEHAHHWRERYITIRGVDCCSGLECECGLILDMAALAELVNSSPNNAMVVEKAYKTGVVENG